MKTPDLVGAMKDLIQLAERARDSLELANRWPCPYCGRKGPGEDLRMIESRVPDHPEVPVALIGCSQCVDADPLVQLAKQALGKVGL